MEKPHLIYALPRSRSTAILQASKKLKKIPEPNSPHRLNPSNKKNLNWETELKTIQEWNNITKTLDDKDTVAKILPINFEFFPISIKWYNKIIEENTHDIFVVQRDLKQLSYSFILAETFGWYKHEEKQIDEDVEIPLGRIPNLMNHLNCFLKYFPKNAKLISWETLPENLFDKNTVTLKEQYSIKNLDKVKNKDFFKENIENIVKVYTPLIEEKISTLE